MRVLTAAELRAVDVDARDRLGLPTIVLMEHAGLALAEAVRKALENRAGRVFVACGKGNNGGDGWTAARWLLAMRIPCLVVASGSVQELKGDARTMAEAAVRLGIDLGASLDAAGRGDVVVDAVLGTGLSRPADGPARDLIDAVNAARARGAYVVAADLPSGLDADQHHPIGPHVVADETVSFHALKKCLVQHPSMAAAGRVQVASIGVPKTHENEGISTLEPAWVRGQLTPRVSDAHKGTAGHVLVVAGSAGKSGAAALVCRGALRAGAGLVTLAAPREVLDRVMPELPEAMGLEMPEIEADALVAAMQGKRALVIGPGIARGPATGAEIVAAVDRLDDRVRAVVLDADALNAIADGPAPAGQKRVHVVMTPHPTELARLLGTTTEAVQADRFEAGAKASQRFGATVVVKGAGSLVVDGTRTTVNTTGTPAMATAGSGDVLAGIIGALAAQGVDEAARVGVYLHGRAGELAAKADRGLLASEIADKVPFVIAELS
jgi:NAD(P)H-hydrate epimerase